MQRLIVQNAFSRDGIDVEAGHFSVRTSQHASVNHAGGRMTRYWLQTLRVVVDRDGVTTTQPAEIDVTDLVESGEVQTG